MFEKPKYYLDCAHLKMDLFLDIMETGNREPLCYFGKPNKKVLIEIWAKIEEEYEKITANPEYYQSLARTNEDYKVINRLEGLIILYNLMRLNPDNEYLDYKQYWEVDEVDLKGLESIIKREKTRFEIDKIQEKSLKKAKDDNVKPMTIEGVKLSVEEWLNKDYIDFSKITVKEWVEMCHRANEKSKALKDARTS